MLVLLVVIPSAGLLSDRIGRKPILLFSVAGLAALGYPLIWLMHHSHYLLIQTGQFGFAVLVGIYLGTSPAAMAEAFPAHVRCSALSVGYNPCLAVFGGTTPMVAAYLIEKTHEDLSIAYYLVAAALISLFVTPRLPETAK